MDISDPQREGRRKVVEDVLEKLRIKTGSIIDVFNKSDQVGKREQERILMMFSANNPVCVSAKTGTGCSFLKETIEKHLSLV